MVDSNYRSSLDHLIQTSDLEALSFCMLLSRGLKVICSVLLFSLGCSVSNDSSTLNYTHTYVRGVARGKCMWKQGVDPDKIGL